MHEFIIAGIIILIVVLAFVFVGPAMDFLLAIAGFKTITFDMLGTFTSVEAKLITNPTPEFAERVIDKFAPSAQTIDFDLQPGEEIKWIQWNANEVTASTVNLNYVVTDDAVIDKNGVVILKICTTNERRCLGSSLQECGGGGLQWNTLTTCEFGCNPLSLSCEPAPEPPPVTPPPQEANLLGILATILIGGVVVVVLIFRFVI